MPLVFLAIYFRFGALGITGNERTGAAGVQAGSNQSLQQPTCGLGLPGAMHMHEEIAVPSQRLMLKAGAAGKNNCTRTNGV